MPEARVVALAREWLRYAEEDLRAARLGLERRAELTARHVCFDAQQAAEKAIKAGCVLHQIEFPFSHDPALLAQSLPGAFRLRAPDEELRWLVQWATVQRYPGSDEPGWDDAERALALADGLVADVRAGMT